MTMRDKLLMWMSNLVVLATYGRTALTYFAYFFKFPNVILPKDINEKMFWRKVFDHDPDFTVFSDKLAVKDYARSVLPDLACAEVYWRGSDIRSAPAEAFAKPSIFKPNHTSGLFVRLPGGRPDVATLQALGSRWLRRRHDKVLAQWGYLNVKPELFLEQDLSTSASTELLDLNLYVFGESVALIIATLGEKTGNERVGLFDATGKRLEAYRKSLPLRKRPVALPADFKLPVSTTELCASALALAGGKDHLRVDFMWNGEQLYLCEITVYPGSGFRLFSDPAIIRQMSQLWNLNRSWFLTSRQTGWRARYAKWLRHKLEEDARQ